MDNIERVSNKIDMIIPAVGWRYAFLVINSHDDGPDTYEIETRDLLGWALVKEDDYTNEIVGIGIHDPTYIHLQTIPTLIDHMTYGFLGYLAPGKELNMSDVEHLIHRFKSGEFKQKKN